jgi:8-oxo-dGTP diphosphatase
MRMAVDLIILTVRHGSFQVLLIERGQAPFDGLLALPGGFLRLGETPREAAVRELKEEAGLNGSSLHLEQLPVYGAPHRDPRGRVVSVPYLAIAPDLPVPVAGSDARAARWESVDAALMQARSLAFDHGEILADAVERARTRLEHTTVAAAFCADLFTIGELRQIYEAVWGTPLDAGNFSRKVTKSNGFVVATGDKRVFGTGRPAALYRRGPARRLHPPMLRTGD